MSMTVEQAKSELMQIYGMLSPDKQRAIDTLVKIEPCEDAISRQEVLDGIEELKKSPWATDKRGFGFEYLIKEALEVVADLCVKQAPSVNPQEPKRDRLYSWLNDMRYGIAPDETVTDIDERNVRTAQVDLLDEIMEWIEKHSQEPKIGHWIPTYGNVMCSVCGNVKDSRNVGKATHYCDQCGCKMAEPKESEDK